MHDLNSQYLKRYILACIMSILVTCNTTIFPGITVPTALASSRQEGFITDSTPYLVVDPSQLSEKICQTSNRQNWTCIVTLYGHNIDNTIAWSAYTPNSSISIKPHEGYLAKVQSIMQVTISHIPCMSTSFLFSGQVLGGGGVIPTTILWSCKQKPTPAPTHNSLPTPTPKIQVPTSTPVATSIPRSTPTMALPPTSVISSGPHIDPPTTSNDNSSANIFLVSALIVLSLEAFVLVVLLAVLIRRAILRRP